MMLDEFCKNKVEPYLGQKFLEFSKFLNVYDDTALSMKREKISDKGIWRGKKMYILNVWNDEGVQYDEPKIKVQGIEAVRSSTPQMCRDAIKSALRVIMNGTPVELRKFVDDVREKFMTAPFLEISFPRTATDIEKWSDPTTVYKKSTPIHVKGSLMFNALLKKYDIKDVEPVRNGDKIRFSYLKTPNPINERVIASPDVELPKEFNLDRHVDREMQFTKAFLDPLRSITDAIGWKLVEEATLEEFFL
jgi:DNA polymerase elongation subunit (family B)